MVRDDNKGISSISYNHLHLPVKIVMAGGNIEYLYDATGVKLKKTVTEPGRPVKTQDYLSGFIYSNGVLELFPTAEGYVKNTVVSGANSFNYVYNYTDHLGNVRVSYGQDPVTQAVKILEENNYYPFGLKHKNYNMSQKNYTKTNGGVSLDPICVNCAVPFKYNYKYQGQERQDELGLNWDSFKWRNYDYTIGRFFNVDPLAEKYAYNSPYAFQENKMGMGRELEGLELITFAQMTMYYQILKSSFNGKVSQARSNLQSGVNNRVSVGISGREKNNMNVAGLNVNKVTDYGNIAKSTGTIATEAKVVAKQVTRDTADALETGGDGVTAVGIATGQPEIIAAGQTISSVGTAINTAVDIGEGNFAKAGETVVKEVVTGGLGTIAKKRSK